MISEDSAIESERSGAEVQSHFSRHESSTAGKKATEQPQCDRNSGQGSALTEEIDEALERKKEIYTQERIRTTSFKISAKGLENELRTLSSKITLLERQRDPERESSRRILVPEPHEIVASTSRVMDEVEALKTENLALKSESANLKRQLQELSKIRHRPAEDDATIRQDSVTLYTSEKFSRFRHHIYLLLLLIVTSAITFYTMFFVYNASISTNPNLSQLPLSSDLAIFRITILTQITVILLTELTNLTTEKYRWSRVCSHRGMSFFSFLSFGCIPPQSLILLLGVTIWEMIRRGIKPFSYQWIILQRFSHGLW